MISFIGNSRKFYQINLQDKGTGQYFPRKAVGIGKREHGARGRFCRGWACYLSCSDELMTTQSAS